MIRIERTITIHRPIQEVFGYLSDVEHGPAYISGQRTARKTSAGPVGLGTTFATSGGLLHGSESYEITEYQPYSRLGWTSTSGPSSTMIWGFEPSGPSTRVTYTSVVSMAGPLRLAEPIMQGIAGGRADHDLGRLKELLAVTRTSATGERSW
jgi:carbon monoxide dehydrogenase subunit G